MTSIQPPNSIDAIETIEVIVPRTARNRFATSYATLPDARHALVRVRVGETIGIGEAPAELWWTGEDADSVRNAIHRYLAPALIGNAADPRQAVRRMDAALADNPYAKAAIEMALWDALGQIAGLPLCELLGGRAEPVPIKYVIGIVDPAEAEAQSEWGITAGFTTLKVKVGGALEADVARVSAVVDAVGGRARVGVDANGGWTLVTALQALESLHDLGVVFLEQPVHSRYPHAMREITRRSPITVVAHESIFTVQDGLAAVADPLAHIWALTPSTHGSLVATLDLLGLARAAGIPCLLGSTVELGVATAFMAQIGAAFDTIHGCPVPSDVIGPLYHESDIVANGVALRDGFALVPDGAGLGVTLDSSAVARFAVGSWR